jgi:hypothetical protein
MGRFLLAIALLLVPCVGAAQGLAGAVKYFEQVSPESPYAVESRFLIAMTRFHQGMHRSAVVAWDDVVIATADRPRRGERRSERRELERVRAFAAAHRAFLSSGTAEVAGSRPLSSPPTVPPALRAVVRTEFDDEIRRSEQLHPRPR